MADVSSWNVELGATRIDPNEKLFLFGYSCKLFPQDEKADYIDKGHHLIPWMGDKTLMIDRYDVRGYLHDLKQYEPKPGGYDHSSDEEKLIDEERYRSLRTDMTEEQLYQEIVFDHRLVPVFAGVDLAGCKEVGYCRMKD